MNRPLRMLGLDLSQAATAVARTHASDGQPNLSVATYDTALLGLHEQIRVITGRVRQATRAGIDLAVVEGTFSRQGGSASDYPLHAVRAHVLQALWERGVPYVDVAPKTLKVWVFGKGEATKRQMCAAIIATYGRLLTVSPTDDNACDAVGLLSMGLARYGQPLVPEPPVGVRALKVPKWPKLALAA